MMRVIIEEAQGATIGGDKLYAPFQRPFNVRVKRDVSIEVGNGPKPTARIVVALTGKVNSNKTRASVL